MGKKILKFLGEILVCIVFAVAAVVLAYMAYSVLFGAEGDMLRDLINSVL
ncbi:MAG: hypothetical protein IJ315_08245 [Firmicutes bacterium]|nr:hypothetical protein [Bacillota bacterium]